MRPLLVLLAVSAALLACSPVASQPWLPSGPTLRTIYKGVPPVGPVSRMSSSAGLDARASTDPIRDVEGGEADSAVQAGASSGGSNGAANLALSISISGVPRQRSRVKQFSAAPVAEAGPVPPTRFTASMAYSALGLNGLDQRLANNGNQFNNDPPDQALCVGNGYIVEGVNLAMRVRYADTGLPATGVVDLNTFFGLPAAIDRTTPVEGPFLTDPTCIYDGDTKRFYFVILVVGFPEKSTILIAVSKTSDPAGEWFTYAIPVQNDGTDGTPNHGNGPAIGDYPQIGNDGYGFYITTNEFPFGGGYGGANVYAISKTALAAGLPAIPLTEFLLGFPAFTIMPAKRPATPGPKDGVAYFTFTEAPASDEGASDIIWLLQFSNTGSLDTGRGTLGLTATPLSAGQQIVVPRSTVNQKDGYNPLGQVGNPRSEFPGNQPVGRLDVSDARMLGLHQAAGKLWGVCATQLTTATGVTRMGVFVFQIIPQARKLQRIGVLAMPLPATPTNEASNHLIIPTIAVNEAGKGAIGFTLVGADYYPTAAYALIDNNGIGPIQVANLGKGVADGFSEYAPFYNDGSPRPRWGDYGASCVDERGSVYLANEFIAAEACMIGTDATIISQCGGTRAYLINWATAITKLAMN